MLTLVSWNCSYEKGGFDKNKFDYITQKYKPHILIVQECKYSECIQLKSLFQNFTWYGDGKDSNLGIGIFSKEHKFELIKEYRYNTNFRYVIPYSFNLGNAETILFAVWTKNSIDKFHKLAYLDNIIGAIEFYNNILNKNIIMIGDFNSADKPGRKAHFDLESKLSKYNITNRISKDLETEPTFYMYFDENNSFTDDYCFASETVKIKNIEIGELCLEYSDQRPLIVTLDY